MDGTGSLDLLLDLSKQASPQQIKDLTSIFKLAATKPNDFGLICHYRGKVQHCCDVAPRIMGLTEAGLLAMDYFTGPDKFKAFERTVKKSRKPRVVNVAGRKVWVYTVWLCDLCGVDVVVGVI